MSMGEVRAYNLDNDIRYALFKFVLKHHDLKTRDMRSADSKQYIELNIWHLLNGLENTLG